MSDFSRISDDYGYHVHGDFDDYDYEDDGNYDTLDEDRNDIQEVDLAEYKLFNKKFPIFFTSLDSVAYTMLRYPKWPMVTYSQLLQLANQCQGILKAWQTRLVKQGGSWDLEKRTSLTTFDKSTVEIGELIDLQLNLYQQPQVQGCIFYNFSGFLQIPHFHRI